MDDDDIIVVCNAGEIVFLRYASESLCSCIGVSSEGFMASEIAILFGCGPDC